MNIPLEEQGIQTKGGIHTYLFTNTVELLKNPSEFF